MQAVCEAFPHFGDARVRGIHHPHLERVCRPDPELRGHARTQARGDQYSVERFITEFDLEKTGSTSITSSLRNHVIVPNEGPPGDSYRGGGTWTTRSIQSAHQPTLNSATSGTTSSSVSENWLDSDKQSRRGLTLDFVAAASTTSDPSPAAQRRRNVLLDDSRTSELARNVAASILEPLGDR